MQCDVLMTAGTARRDKSGLVEVPSVVARELMIDSLFDVQSDG
jgi:hypothetical protein